MGVIYEKIKLKKTVYSGFADLSKEEIKNLIKKETEKDPEEADADYIDFCFDLLQSKADKLTGHIKNNYKPKKALLVAAIIIVFIISSLTVSSTVFDYSIPRKLAELIDGNAQIDFNLEDADTSADGYALTDTEQFKELAAHGITPVTLPECLTDENCAITNIFYPDSPYSIIAYIDFNYNGHDGNIRIEQFFEKIEFVGEYTSMDVKSGHFVRANGMDVMIFEHKNGYCTVIYKDNMTQYDLYLCCDLDTTLEVVKSIK